MASDAFYQAYVEILPSAKGLRAALAKEFDAVGPEAGRNAGKGIKTGVLGAVGKLAAPLAVAFAGLQIGSIIKDSIGNASDFAEAGTAITAVFGPADKTVQAFAANSATALGQSKNQTLDAARTFGVFGKAAGLGGEDLAGFSTEFITLAADLASFNNTTPEQAIQALGAGLRGESEPLRQYGVLLDDAALKARATELGIYSGTGALTQQQKVLAAQAEIMAQTGTQQGDFAKTSGGLANQQRILSAGLTNLSTTFGAILLPVMLTIVGFLNTSVIPAFSGLIDFLAGGGAAAGVSGFIAGFQPIIDFFTSTFEPVFDALKPLFTSLAPIFASLLPQVIELAASFSPLGLIFQAITPILPQLVGAIGQLVAMLAGALSGALTSILPALTSLSGVFVGLIGGLLTTLLPIIVELVGMLGPVLSAVIAAVVPLFASLAGIVGQLFAAIVPLLAPILSLIAPLAQLVAAILPPLVSLFAAILTPIIALVGVILGALIPVIQFLVTVLAAIIGGIVNVITWFVNLITGSKTAQAQFMSVWKAVLSFFGGIWSGITGFVSDGIGNVIGFFRDLPNKVMSALGNLGSLLLNSGKSLIQGFIDGIKGMIGAVGDAVGGVMDFVGGFFPNSPAKRGQFAGSGWTRIKNAGLAVGDQFGAGLDASTDALELGSTLSLPSVPRLAASVYGAAVSGQGAAFPGTVTLVDADGSLLGRMRVVVDQAGQANALTSRMGRQR